MNPKSLKNFFEPYVDYRSDLIEARKLLEKLLNIYMKDVDANLEPKTPVLEMVTVWLEVANFLKK